MDDSVKAALKKCFDQKQRLQIRADTVGVSDRIYRRICGLAQQEVTISLPVSRSFPAETVEEPEFHGNIKIFSFSELAIFPSCAKLKTRKQAELAPNKNYLTGGNA